jgi:hypothetical protein
MENLVENFLKRTIGIAGEDEIAKEKVGLENTLHAVIWFKAT